MASSRVSRWLSLLPGWLAATSRYQVLLIIGFLVIYMTLSNVIEFHRLNVDRTSSSGKGTESLEEADDLMWRARKRKSSHRPGLPPLHCKKMRLSLKQALPSTALASFPGSGNTWLRHLIQEATGIYTGSIYEDRVLKRSGFPAEGLTNSSVIVVKTHMYGPSSRSAYSKAILLIRNPMEAMLAEFHRKLAGHRGHAPFNLFESKVWRGYVIQSSRNWVYFNLDWLSFSGPLLVTRYDDLKNNLTGELNRIGSFLGQNITEDDLDCMHTNIEGLFHRRQFLSRFNPYSEPIKAMVEIFIKTVDLALAVRHNNKELSTFDH